MQSNSFTILDNSLQEKLKTLNINQPTNVQEKVIPQIAAGKNILFQSETGTGKTFAYLLPLVNKMEKEQDSKLRLLIVAPTFELASQINTAAKSITQRKTALLIGGSPIKRQIETLKEKPQIVWTVRHNLDLNFLHLRRKTAERFDQTRITLYFKVEVVDDLVIRPHTLIEIMIAGRHFLQSVGHVERPLLFLRIEQDGEFVRPCDDIDHPLMLTLVLFVESLLCLRHLITQRLQFQVQFFEGVGQSTLVHSHLLRHRADSNYSNSYEADYFFHC